MYAQAICDEGTTYPWGKAHKTREPEAVWEAVAKALPGSLVRMEGQSASSVPPTFSRAFAMDRGGEYKGAFKANGE